MIVAFELNTRPRIVDRQTAREAGLKLYFTGKPCRNGHLAQRLTSSGVCVLCKRAKK